MDVTQVDFDVVKELELIPDIVAVEVGVVKAGDVDDITKLVG